MLFNDKNSYVIFLIAVGVSIFLNCSPTVDEVYSVVEEGNNERLLVLLEKKGNVGDPSISNYPLRLAVEKDDEEAIKLLLTYGANPNFKMNNVSVIDFLVNKERTNVIKLMLDYGLDPNTSLIESGNSLLTWASLNRASIDFIIELVAKGANIEFTSPSGYTALFFIISEYSTEDLEKFLQLSPNLYATSSKGFTTFYSSILDNKPEASLKLLEYGYNLESESNKASLSYEMVSRIDVFFDKLADAMVSKRYFFDPELPLLQVAIDSVNYESARWLLENGFNPKKEYPNAEGDGYQITAIDQYYDKYYRLTHYAGGDTKYEVDHPDVIKLNRIYDLMMKYVGK